MMHDFDISVVIAMPSHHGHAVECVQSWSQSQTYSQERFEVLLVGSGQDAQIDALINGLVRKQDRLLHHSSINDFCLYDYGARQANGWILVFTEGHCIADKNCLQAVADFLNQGHCGAALNSRGIYSTYAGELEEQLYQQQIRMRSSDGYLLRMPLRGFALYQSTFLETGGFDHQYARFTERALGIRLEELGLRTDFAESAKTFHYNIIGAEELFEPVKDFVAGACLYRSTFSNQHCIRYLGQSQLSSERQAWNAHVIILQLQALLSYLFGSFRRIAALPNRLNLIGHLLRLTLALLIGFRLELLAARLAVYAGFLRTRVMGWFDKSAGMKALRVFWLKSLVRYYELQFLVGRQESEKRAAEEELIYDVGELGNDNLIGFYSREEHAGQIFRWSQPVAVIPVSLPKRDLHLDLKVLNVRRAIDAGVQPYLNRHQLLPLTDHVEETTLSYFVPISSMEEQNYLILVCSPFKPGNDPRHLGVPVNSLRFHYSDDCMDSSRQQTMETRTRPPAATPATTVSFACMSVHLPDMDIARMKSDFHL